MGVAFFLFAWLNESQEGLTIGEDAYCIVPSNLPANPTALYGAYFTSIEKPDTIPYITKGVLLRNFYVYRLKGAKLIPASILKPKKVGVQVNQMITIKKLSNCKMMHKNRKLISNLYLLILNLNLKQNYKIF